MTALLLVSVMSSVLPDDVIVADPAETVPLTGLAKAAVTAKKLTRDAVDKKVVERKSAFLIKDPRLLFRPYFTVVPTTKYKHINNL